MLSASSSCHCNCTCACAAAQFGGGRHSRGADPEPASDDEVYFSDDEAEQHYLRQVSGWVLEWAVAM